MRATQPQIIQISSYVNSFGEKRKLLFYKKTKSYAETNLGQWDFSKCFACFVGRHDVCCGSCTCR